MNTFVTADTHFNHANIIQHCNRPWRNVEEMNAGLIKNWNNVVNEKDTAYILGDFVWNAKIDDILNQLKGNKILILGGHDDDRLLTRQIIPTFNYKEIRINGTKYVLFHYPIEEWNNKPHNAIHLHGHSHGNSRPMPNRFDVGVDVWMWCPVNIEAFKPMENSRNG